MVARAILFLLISGASEALSADESNELLSGTLSQRLGQAQAIELSEAVPSPVAKFTESQTSNRSIKGLKVALDIGHTPGAPGAISARGRGEYQFNKGIVDKLDPALRRIGADVTVINPQGAEIGLGTRALKANSLRSHVFLSIHHDSVNKIYKERWEVDGRKQEFSDKFKGFSVFFSSKNPMASESRELAAMLGRAMLRAGFEPTAHHADPIPGENRDLLDRSIGLYDFPDLVVLKATQMPAALLECGVIVHRAEELILQEPATHDRIIRAVESALIHFAPIAKRQSPAAAAATPDGASVATKPRASAGPTAKSAKSWLKRLFD